MWGRAEIEVPEGSGVVIFFLVRGRDKGGQASRRGWDLCDDYEISWSNVVGWILIFLGVVVNVCIGVGC